MFFFTRLIITAVEYYQSILISVCVFLHSSASEQSVWGETKILYAVCQRVSYFGTVKNIRYFLYTCVCVCLCVLALVCGCVLLLLWDLYSSRGTVH